MNNNLLLGFRRYLLPIPRLVWQKQVLQNAKQAAARLEFMSKDHQLVRNFVVQELLRAGKPLPPEHIAQNLNLPAARVNTVLEELEKRKLFLFRNGQGAVAWAYPVTVDPTPHLVKFTNGEQVHAA